MIFLEKAEQLHVHIDFSQKHSRFMMTDRAMTKPIRGRQLSKRDLYDEDFLECILPSRDCKSFRIFVELCQFFRRVTNKIKRIESNH